MRKIFIVGLAMVFCACFISAAQAVDISIKDGKLVAHYSAPVKVAKFEPGNKEGKQPRVLQPGERIVLSMGDVGSPSATVDKNGSLTFVAPVPKGETRSIINGSVNGAKEEWLVQEGANVYCGANDQHPGGVVRVVAIKIVNGKLVDATGEMAADGFAACPGGAVKHSFSEQLKMK